MSARPSVLLDSEPHLCVCVTCYLVLACSSIACRNYPRGLVDRAPQDCEQSLELVYRSLRRILVGCSRAVNVSPVQIEVIPLSPKDRAPLSLLPCRRVCRLDHPFYLIQNPNFVFVLLVILFLLVIRLLAGITLVVWLIVLHNIANSRWSWCIGR